VTVEVHPLADREGGWPEAVIQAAVNLAAGGWNHLSWQTQLYLLGEAEQTLGLKHEPRSGEHHRAADEFAYISKRMKEIGAE